MVPDPGILDLYHQNLILYEFKYEHAIQMENKFDLGL
jgi:hypothetical protein